MRNKLYELNVFLKNKEHNTKILDIRRKNEIIVLEFFAYAIF